MAFRVLMVDDDADLLAMFREALESDGFCVETCATVQNATLALQRGGFDAVVTDLGLERTGGLAFCEQLATSPSAPPVIVMTGYAEARAAALRLGARSVLIKPVSIDELKRELRSSANEESRRFLR
ncbi:MAG TPA: response regulator [Polyangiaceae bacterium]